MAGLGKNGANERTYALIMRVWESRYGTLTVEQQDLFMNHRAMPYICCYRDSQIEKSILRNKKLDKVLTDLESRYFWVKDKHYPGYKSGPGKKRKAEAKLRKEANNFLLKSEVEISCVYCEEYLDEEAGDDEYICARCQADFDYDRMGDEWD